MQWSRRKPLFRTKHGRSTSSGIPRSLRSPSLPRLPGPAGNLSSSSREGRLLENAREGGTNAGQQIHTLWRSVRWHLWRSWPGVEPAISCSSAWPTGRHNSTTQRGNTGSGAHATDAGAAREPSPRHGDAARLPWAGRRWWLPGGNGGHRCFASSCRLCELARCCVGATADAWRFANGGTDGRHRPTIRRSDAR